MKKESMKKMPDRRPKDSSQDFRPAIQDKKNKTIHQKTEHWNLDHELLVQRIRNSG